LLDVTVPRYLPELEGNTTEKPIRTGSDGESTIDAVHSLATAHRRSPTVKRTSKMYAGAGSALMLGSVALAGGLMSTSASAHDSTSTPVVVRSNLGPLNDSGITGKATVVFRGDNARVSIDAYGLAPDLPHAEHIHFGAEARHECPTFKDDTNLDFRLNTSEGLPAYGPIKKSLTTRGDTSPASALAVNRFPTAPGGVIHYERTIHIGSAKLMHAIEAGKSVLVVHGIDYNDNGAYDFASAGKSDLDPSLPAEATDPAACGVLR
jgi:hypothetical protein